MFIPYKIDHQEVNAGKTLSFSKKKVIFKFGFANQEAIDRGETGPACRGSEHEVIFIWSLTKGKRQLFCDGKDVHYSESGQNGWTTDRSWQHSFPLRDPSTKQEYRVHIISRPPRPEIPGFQPFDLRINGTSYFHFSELWKLGTPDMLVRGDGGLLNAGQRYEHYNERHLHDADGDGGNEALSAEEERQIAQAKLESLRDLARHQEQEQERAAAANEQRALPVIESAPSDWGHAGLDHVTAAPPNPTPELISFDAPPPSQVLVLAPAPVYGPPAAPPYAMMDPFAPKSPPAPAPAYSSQPPFSVSGPHVSPTQQLAPYTGPPAPYGGGYGGVGYGNSDYGAAAGYGTAAGYGSSAYGTAAGYGSVGGMPDYSRASFAAPSSAPIYSPPSTSASRASFALGDTAAAAPPAYVPYSAAPATQPPPALHNPFASPGGQTEYTYGSAVAAPAFALPPTSPPDYSYHQMPSPQQQRSQYGAF